MHKPEYKDFHTSEGMHSAMWDYAKLLNKPSLIAKVIFADGSEMIEEFEHATKEVFYRVSDKEEGLYSVEIHTGKYKEPFFADRALSSKELKEGFINWLSKHNPMGSFKVYWSEG